MKNNLENENRNNSENLTVGLMESPAGSKVVGMSVKGETWLHFHNFSPMDIGSVRQIFKEHHVEIKLGLAVQNERSIKEGSLILEDDSGSVPKFGVYVKADKYDSVAAAKSFGMIKINR